uniref:Conserved oligomeric Golgi complex subunit 1 n=1 Tax=Apis cerana TaxID=7461 RepID=V9ICW8_APICE
MKMKKYRNKSRFNHYSNKILMDVPQYIWSSIENKDLLFATQLYLIAQHINYSLLFEVGSTDLSIKYPIVSKQWDVINQFKNIILNKCNNVLQSLDVQPGSIANCLAAFVLLNGTSFSDLLDKLISMHSEGESGGLILQYFNKNSRSRSIFFTFSVRFESRIITRIFFLL